MPADLHCFGTLLRRLGVRERFEATQYLQLLQALADGAAGAPLPPEPLQMVLAIVQQLASPQHQPLPPRPVHLPDSTGTLLPRW